MTEDTAQKFRMSFSKKLNRTISVPLCAICLREIDANFGQITNCKHEFCEDCIREWLRQHDTCPLDRIPVEDVIIMDSDKVPLDTIVPNIRLCNSSEIMTMDAILTEILSATNDEYFHLSVSNISDLSDEEDSHYQTLAAAASTTSVATLSKKKQRLRSVQNWFRRLFRMERI